MMDPMPFGSLSDEKRRLYEMVSALELDTYRKFRQSGGTHAGWCLLSPDERKDLSCTGDEDEDEALAYANLQALGPDWMPWLKDDFVNIKREREGTDSVVLFAVPAQAFTSVHPMSLPFITSTSFCISVALDKLGKSTVGFICKYNQIHKQNPSRVEAHTEQMWREGHHIQHTIGRLGDMPSHPLYDLAPTPTIKQNRRFPRNPMISLRPQGIQGFPLRAQEKIWRGGGPQGFMRRRMKT